MTGMCHCNWSCVMLRIKPRASYIWVCSPSISWITFEQPLPNLAFFNPNTTQLRWIIVTAIITITNKPWQARLWVHSRAPGRNKNKPMLFLYFKRRWFLLPSGKGFVPLAWHSGLGCSSPFPHSSSYLLRTVNNRPTVKMNSSRGESILSYVGRSGWTTWDHVLKIK